MPIVHSSTCVSSNQIYQEHVAEFKKKHPSHCTKCNGWGMHVMPCDPQVGAGIEVDTCPDCVDKECCPLCMNKGSRLFDHDDNVLLCTECGWREDDDKHVGVHDEPECYCDWGDWD